MIRIRTIFVHCLVLLITVNNVRGKGGSCWAPSSVFGATCVSDEVVSPGADATDSFKISYKVTVNANAGGSVCCQGRSHTNPSTSTKWTSIGCGFKTFGTTVFWGNNAGLPAIRCKGNPFGASVSWSY